MVPAETRLEVKRAVRDVNNEGVGLECVDANRACYMIMLIQANSENQT